MSQLINQKMVKCFKEIKSIQKDQKNQAQGWNFRGYEAVYNEIHKVLSKNDVFILPEVLEWNDEILDFTDRYGNKKKQVRVIIKMKYSFIAEDGSKVESIVMGEAMDYGDKAMNKAMTYAQKYCLLQTFLIPFDKDPDHDVYNLDNSKTIRKRMKVEQVEKATADDLTELLEASGNDKDAVKQKMLKKYGVTQGAQLTKEQVKALIKEFKGE